ncbi:hypothetical protein ASPFODRAFT_39478 [Aspergillus luchuensis CBS 106.47]|uniref:Uncharacterized protein n=1 Tax=Aspergillus luchuensis (strain CBS 106.47) TaxID=1137211 RepID=A0A1M3TZJ0_ASPLC|nr:hypothetical protein ASPFODRAFT_39478 [Aspergillus luchuensis CBS 106.47]
MTFFLYASLTILPSWGAFFLSPAIHLLTTTETLVDTFGVIPRWNMQRAGYGCLPAGISPPSLAHSLDV